MYINYPWYAVVNGDDIEQGDIFRSCPIYFPPANLAVNSVEFVEFHWKQMDLIVLTQSCDLVKGIEKVTDILFCGLWPAIDFDTGQQSLKKVLEDIRKGRQPGFHILNKCEIFDHETDFLIVDFRKIFSLPIPFIREFAINHPPRLRHLPPYREHLSQAFARNFMRVGLPVDIPAF